VVAIWTGDHTRWGLKDLDDVFAESRDHAQDPEAEPPPWSSFDLAVLRDDVASIDRHDPFATLARASSPISWHDPSNGNGRRTKRIAWRPPVGAA
jgi:hypothetical protein